MIFIKNIGIGLEGGAKAESNNDDAGTANESPKGSRTMSFFIECCNKKIRIDDERVVELEPQSCYINRVLLYGVCPVCKNIRLQLREYDTIQQRWVIDRGKPRRLKNVKLWAEQLEKQHTHNYLPNTKIKYGNKSNMAFIFGITKQSNGVLFHEGYDWNGTQRKRFEANDFKEA